MLGLRSKGFQQPKFLRGEESENIEVNAKVEPVVVNDQRMWKICWCKPIKLYTWNIEATD